MTNLIQLKRRNSGLAGAPSALKSGELAMNFVDDVLYIGKGDDGSGNATSVIALAGIGKFVDSTSTQSISGHKTFSNPVTVGAPSNDGHAATKKYVDDIIGALEIYEAGVGITIDVDGVVAVDQSIIAPLVSPAFSGAPTAPTATAGTTTTQIATTEFVKVALDGLLDSAPGTLDTLYELAEALGNDPDFGSTITTSIAGKLSKDQNLADLQNASTARNNLGLGSISQQNANSVNITGGTISGTTIDAGAF